MPENTSCTIFYSWQSDSPNSTNRGFIEEALRKAAKALREDDSIKVDPRIDSDTQGEPGAPDIAGTILKKIDKADVFVGDVTIIGEAAGRPTPNPNVLVELGYALKAIGHERTVLVMNVEFGGPEKLPFDLRQRTVLTYRVSADRQDKAAVRTALARNLQSRIGLVFEHLPARPAPAPASERVVAAINAGARTVKREVRQFMEWLVAALDAYNPKFAGSDEQNEDELLAALASSVPIVVEFTKVADVAADVAAENLSLDVLLHFDQVLTRYNNPEGFSGPFKLYKFDFYKFLGHELAVTLVAFLMRARQWQRIAEIARQEFVVRNWTHGRQTVEFDAISEHLQLLEMRKLRLRSNRISLHADLLKERHTTPPLRDVLPFELFAEADLLLYLRGELEYDQEIINAWVPRSGPVMGREAPRFLLEAQNPEYARRMMVALGVDNVDVLKRRLSSKKSVISRRVGQDDWVARGPLAYFDPDKIGTR